MLLQALGSTFIVKNIIQKFAFIEFSRRTTNLFK